MGNVIFQLREMDLTDESSSQLQTQLAQLRKERLNKIRLKLGPI